MAKAATVYDFRQPSHDEMVCCSECAIVFYSPIISQRRDDGKTFYCPNGHAQYFGKSKAELEAERLREELSRTQQRVTWITGQRDAAEKKTRQLQRRIAKGVCPCCQRSFENLSRHMATKHPEFSKDKVTA